MFVQQHHHHHHQRQLHAPLLTTSSNSGSSCLSLVPTLLDLPPRISSWPSSGEKKNPTLRLPKSLAPTGTRLPARRGQVRHLLRMLTKSPPKHEARSLWAGLWFSRERERRASRDLPASWRRPALASYSPDSVTFGDFLCGKACVLALSTELLRRGVYEVFWGVLLIVREVLGGKRDLFWRVSLAFDDFCGSSLLAPLKGFEEGKKICRFLELEKEKSQIKILAFLRFSECACVPSAHVSRLL